MGITSIYFYVPVFHLLCRVHLPLEHGERLECDGEVEPLDGVVERGVVLVQVPVVVDVEDGLVVLEAGRELHEFVQGRGNLARNI